MEPRPRLWNLEIGEEGTGRSCVVVKKVCVVVHHWRQTRKEYQKIRSWGGVGKSSGVQGVSRYRKESEGVLHRNRSNCACATCTELEPKRKNAAGGARDSSMSGSDVTVNFRVVIRRVHFRRSNNTTHTTHTKLPQPPPQPCLSPVLTFARSVQLFPFFTQVSPIFFFFGLDPVRRPVAVAVVVA